MYQSAYYLYTDVVGRPYPVHIKAFETLETNIGRIAGGRHRFGKVSDTARLVRLQNWKGVKLRTSTHLGNPGA